MATVIDSLVVTLGLDPRQFEEGSREAMSSFEKTKQEAMTWGKSIEEQGKKLTDVFATLKGGLVGILGAFVGGEIASFVDQTARMDAATGRLSSSLGMSVQKMSMWNAIVQQFGGTAQEAQQSIAGLSDALVHPLLGGGPMNPYLAFLLQQSGMPGMTGSQLAAHGDMNTILMRIRTYMQSLNEPEALKRAQLQQAGIGGNLMYAILASDAEFAQRLQAAKQALPSDKDVKTAEDYVAVAAQLDLALKGLARDTYPALTAAIDSMTSSLEKSGTAMNEMKKGNVGRALFGDLWDYIQSPGANWSGLWDRIRGRGGAAPAQGGGAAGANGPTAAQREAYIRQYAASIGVDPNIAMQVSRSEGFGGLTGDGGSSFGDFQLHYGGMAPGMMQPGLGDLFTKATGLSAKDPTNWQAADKFALDYAKAHGWGPWHGWKGLPNAGIGPAVGAGAAAGKHNVSNQTSSVTIEQINITSNKADPKDVAMEIPDAVRRLSTSMGANSALT